MENIIKFLMKQGIKDFVCEEALKMRENWANEMIGIRDVRSAGFFAIGRAIKLNKPVALIVQGEFISNTYTAITEAWFQKAQVIVIAAYKNISDVKTAWMDRCTLEQMTCGKDEENIYKIFINKALIRKGPSILNVVTGEKRDSRQDYRKIIGLIKNNAEQTINIICYNPFDENKEEYEIGIIEEKHEYGTVSKYVGMSSVGKYGILCCTADCILKDVNIFRTRYANEKMKIIVKDNDGELERNHIDEWIQSNNWDYFKADINDKIKFDMFLRNKQASVLVVEE